MPINNYDTMEIVQALEFRVPITKFFSNFFPTTNTHLSEKIMLDVRKSRHRMAPFVSKRIAGKLMDREGFETYEFTTPKIAPERLLTIDDITKRGFGENLFSTKTPEERATEQLAKDLRELEEYIANRVEWMSRNIVLEGMLDVTVPEDGVDFRIDYNFTNKNTLVGAAAWDSTTSDPLRNLKDWRRDLIKKCGAAPSFILMGNEAYECFIKHKSVKEDLNVLNFNFGNITPQLAGKALTFRGEMREVGQIYTYDDWFVDDDGTEQPFMPPNKVAILPNEIGSMEYGAVTQIEDGQWRTYEATLVPKFFVDDRNNQNGIILTSRPLPRPYDVDSWYVADVIA